VDESEMTREQMIAELAAAAEEMRRVMVAHGAHEPDWTPLEKALPLKHCAGFMFMGYSGNIRMYKHGFTRRYLNLDPEGNTYFYKEVTDSYFRVPKKIALDHAFHGLEEMGVKRSTPFDEKARAERQKALEEAGWTILSADVRDHPASGNP
jgi:hypothetical protein